MPLPPETDLTGHAFDLPASCSLEMGQKDANAVVHDASSADHRSCVDTQVEAVMADSEMDISLGTLVMGGEVEKDSDAASSSQQEIDDEDESMTPEELQVALRIYEAAFVAGAQWMEMRLSLKGATAPSQADIALIAGCRGNVDINLMFSGEDPIRASDE